MSLKKAGATAVAAILSMTTIGAVAGVASADPTKTGDRDPVMRSTNVTYRVIDENVRRRSAVVDDAIQRAANFNADVITFQEVCRSKMNSVAQNHQGWTVAFIQDQTPCPDGLGGGNAVIWRGGNTESIVTKTFDNQGTVASTGEVTSSGIVCLRYGGHYTACSTHLLASDEGISSLQAREVKALTKDWILAGRSVILAGDMNMTPLAPGMSYLYASGADSQGNSANGFFYEASNNANNQKCRCGLSTVNTDISSASPRKIDYVFFGEATYGPGQTSTLTTQVNYPADPGDTDLNSDHLLLKATAVLNVP